MLAFGNIWLAQYPLSSLASVRAGERKSMSCAPDGTDFAQLLNTRLGLLRRAGIGRPWPVRDVSAARKVHHGARLCVRRWDDVRHREAHQRGLRQQSGGALLCAYDHCATVDFLVFILVFCDLYHISRGFAHWLTLYSLLHCAFVTNLSCFSPLPLSNGSCCSSYICSQLYSCGRRATRRACKTLGTQLQSRACTVFRWPQCLLR